MNKRTTIGLLIAIAANLAAAASSHAQIYKWVDANGKVNYSSQPPADSSASKNVKVVESNISVYTPDDSLKRAVEENRQRKNEPAASDHIYAARARPSCADSGMVPSPSGGCQPAESASSDYYPYYAPGVVYNRFRRHPAVLAQAQIPPGTIAGNVVGMNGYIAGNSALAAQMAPPPARPPRPSPGSRGITLK